MSHIEALWDGKCDGKKDVHSKSFYFRYFARLLCVLKKF